MAQRQEALPEIGQPPRRVLAHAPGPSRPAPHDLGRGRGARPHLAVQARRGRQLAPEVHLAADEEPLLRVGHVERGVVREHGAPALLRRRAVVGVGRGGAGWQGGRVVDVDEGAVAAVHWAQLVRIGVYTEEGNVRYQ